MLCFVLFNTLFCTTCYRIGLQHVTQHATCLHGHRTRHAAATSASCGGSRSALPMPLAFGRTAAEQPSTRPGRKMLKCVIVLLSCCACCNARLGRHAPRRHALALARINSSAAPLVWSHGYCGETELGGDCRAGTKGSWRLSRTALSSWDRAAAVCTKLCHSCERCSHVSLSTKLGDCRQEH